MPSAFWSRYVAIRTNAATVTAAICAGGCMITSALVASRRSVSRADRRMTGVPSLPPSRCAVKAAAAGC